MGLIIVISVSSLSLWWSPCWQRRAGLARRSRTSEMLARLDSALATGKIQVGHVRPARRRPQERLAQHDSLDRQGAAQGGTDAAFAPAALSGRPEVDGRRLDDDVRCGCFVVPAYLVYLRTGAILFGSSDRRWLLGSPRSATSCSSAPSGWHKFEEGLPEALDLIVQRTSRGTQLELGPGPGDARVPRPGGHGIPRLL